MASIRTSFTLVLLAALAALPGASAQSFTLGSPVAATTPPGRRSYFDLQPGFAALKAKIESGAPISVVYFGGSITDGDTSFPADPNYNREIHSWRARSFKFLRSQFEVWPGQFTAHNASLGGTGSHLGACRFSRDVTPLVPDLLFVEFTVNDGPVAVASDDPLTQASIQRTIKSIVVQARNANPEVAIFLPLSTMDDFFGSPLPVQSEIERSRDHYRRLVNDPQLRLPFVDLTEAFYMEPLPFGVTTDTLYGGIPANTGNALHPAFDGHEAYAQAVFHSLVNLLANPSFHFKPTAPPLPALAPYPAASPTFVGAADLPASPGWFAEHASEQEPIFANRSVYRAAGPNVVFTHTFTGRSLALWWQIFFDDGIGNLEPLQGRVRIEIDNQVIGTFSVGPGVVPPNGESRLPRFIEVARNLDPTVPHTLQIHVPPNQPPDMVGPVRLALHGLCIG